MKLSIQMESVLINFKINKNEIKLYKLKFIFQINFFINYIVY